LLYQILEVVTWTQLGIHNKPVVLVNVLGFYEPLRVLIHSAIKGGFIEPQNERLVLFVDGPPKSKSKEPDSDLPPSSNTEEEEWIKAHEEFDWGTKALQALDGWDGEKEGFRRYPFEWGRRRDGRELCCILEGFCSSSCCCTEAPSKNIIEPSVVTSASTRYISYNALPV